MFFNEQKQDHRLDRTIPMRRERTAREEQHITDELIRLAMQAASATEAIREEA